MTVNLERRASRARQNMSRIIWCFREHRNHIAARTGACRVAAARLIASFAAMTNQVLLNSGNAAGTRLHGCNEASVLPGQISYN